MAWRPKGRLGSCEAAALACWGGVGSAIRTVKQFVQHSFWLIEISAKDICKH